MAVTSVTSVWCVFVLLVVGQLRNYILKSPSFGGLVDD